MASDVKWIKMMVGMFDGMSFKKIKRAKIGGESFRDKLTAVWFELMALAGRCNHDGYLVSDGIPFTELDDIAIQIDRDEEELKLCMGFFLQEGMVTIENDVYRISNWGEYQNTEGMDKIREQNRIRKRNQRDKLKQIDDVSRDVSRDCHVTVTQCHATEEEKDEEKEKEIHSINHSCVSDEKNDPDSDVDFEAFSTDSDHREETKRNLIGGTLGKGVVFLSDDQMEDLLEKLSLDEFNYYVGVVADCILSGKKYKRKTHYQAILDMAMEDRKIKRVGDNDAKWILQRES